jgi:hypothetical protein
MKLLRSLCVFCHAGLIAQQTKTPTSPSSGGIEDLVQLQVFVKRMPLRMFIHDKKTDGYLLLTPAQRRAAYQRRSERAYYSARKIVIRYWSVVELLASELLSNKTLSRKEVDAIVKPAMEKCKNL